MEQFEEAEKRIKAAGFDVINPAEILKTLKGIFNYNELMGICMELLGRASCIVMLEGWEESRGANREYGFADGSGMDIYKIDCFKTPEERENA